MESEEGRGPSRSLLEWSGLSVLVGIFAGAASAAFLKALELATEVRLHHEVLVYALPLAGVAVGLVYETWGAKVRKGNNLVIDSIHEDSEQIPLRMAPMVLVGTVLTHLFGGSAGREGTAVQMGASLAEAIAHRFRVAKDTRRKLLAAGMAGGFGSVFGTPIAGTLFGLEVVTIGRMEYEALIPAAIASFVGDFVTRSLGVVHTNYPVVASVPLSPSIVGKLCVMGAAMAGTTIVFVDGMHHGKAWLERRVRRLPVRMFLGGVAIVVLWKVVGTSDYLGLGVPTIVRAFSDPQLPVFAFALKLIFTVITLGAGFLGGEVTPLFFVGATLGSVLARLLGLPIALGAGVGIAAVFGAAANTPVALAVMATELLGSGIFPHAFIVCLVAYLLSGHRSIYPSQRLFRSKYGGPVFTSAIALRDYRDERRSEASKSAAVNPSPSEETP